MTLTRKGYPFSFSFDLRPTPIGLSVGSNDSLVDRRHFWVDTPWSVSVETPQDEEFTHIPALYK